MPRENRDRKEKPFVQPMQSDEIGRAHSELQSHHELVCRPLLEKKNKIHQFFFRIDYEVASYMHITY